MTWVPPEADDFYYARLPWPEAQAMFYVPPSTAPLLNGTCGWHGTSVSPDMGAFALVRTDGPFVDLIGDRVRITRIDKEVSVYVYVQAQAEVMEDISLTRRAFMQISAPWREELDVVIEVLSG